MAGLWDWPDVIQKLFEIYSSFLSINICRIYFPFYCNVTAITEVEKDSIRSICNERRSRISATRKIGGKLHVFIASTFCSSVLMRYLRFSLEKYPAKEIFTAIVLEMENWERRRKAVARCNIEPNLVVILFCRVSCPMTKQYWTLAKITPYTK